MTFISLWSPCGTQVSCETAIYPIGGKLSLPMRATLSCLILRQVRFFLPSQVAPERGGLLLLLFTLATPIFQREFGGYFL